MSDLKPFLAAIAAGKTLTEAEAEQAFSIVMSGTATEAQIGALLMGMRVRGETVEEIAGAARVMRANVHAIDAPEGAIDTCGTGGDGSGTLNISTAAAIVTAACGVPVAKHGNRALSSQSGSADVLAALGVDLDADLPLVERSLWDNNIAFLMAPRHHTAMRHVMAARRDLGTRTIFNLLGPLSNPAGTRRQLVGVFAKNWVKPLAEVLARLGADAAWVVHGSDGLDELTVTGPSYVAELKDGRIRTFEVTPEDAGLRRAKIEDLKGGDAIANARALRTLLHGQPGPYRDVVLLNSAAALIVAGVAENLAAGVERAAQAIDSGSALATLDRLVAVGHQAKTTPAQSPA
jgi:anthranilate phosphoribosyltransferase